MREHQIRMPSVRTIGFGGRKKTSSGRELQTSERRQRAEQEDWNGRERSWKKRLSREEETVRLTRGKFLLDEDMGEWSSDETLCGEDRGQGRYKAAKREKSDLWTGCYCCRREVRQLSEQLSERRERREWERRNWKEQCERSIRRALADQKKEKTRKTTTNNLSDITLLLTIALFSNFWQSASILNQLTMENTGPFSLSSRNVVASADTSTAPPSPETDVPNSPMVGTGGVEPSPGTGVVTSSKTNTTGTKKGFKYTVPMPLPGTNGAPYFQGQNVSDFLDRFDFMCEDYELSETDRIKRLPWYCEKTIGEYLRMLTEFNDESWQEVKKVLRKEYEEQDVDQQMNTREFLEALIRKPRTEGDLKAYCRQFYAISTRLYKRKRLDEHTRVRWFLQGLPRETAIKVMRKHNYDDTDDEVLNFEAMHKTAIKMSDAARVLEKLSYY